MKKLSLLEVLEGLEDNRRELSVWYPLHEVLFILLTAIICGATSYAKVETFGHLREEWLRKYLKLEHGIPDVETFRYVLVKFEPEKLHELFAEWMRGVVEHVKGVVAIDGKQARRTGDGEQKPLHVVSAFATEARLVLGQIACEEKSNEITAIPKLLEALELNGSIVTIDAMGTQTKIAKKIRDKGADYILALKTNQTALYEDVSLFFKDYTPDKRGPHYAKTIDKGHGRIETRECMTCEDIDWLNGKERWAGLTGIGHIRSTVEQGEKVTDSDSYFIYSCKNKAASELLAAKRSHWGIENGLHWVLDMQFREDESRARRDHSAENMNILRQMAFNILKSDTTAKGGLTDKQYRCALDPTYLDTVLSAWVCS